MKIILTLTINSDDKNEFIDYHLDHVKTLLKRGLISGELISTTKDGSWTLKTEENDG